MLRRLAALVSKERISVSPERASSFARWKAVPGAVLVQASIGGVYAWSIFNEPLTRNIGVIAASSQDWSLGDVVPIFSCAAISLGVCSALLGPWAERMGPRAVCLTAAGCWSSGLALTGLGVHLHSLPLVYLGYGVLGGAGWGLGYVSPIPALLSWFPDRRGLASGIGLAAFGGGAMLAAPLESWLLSRNFRAPDFLGKTDSVALVTEEGRRFVTTEGGALQEVLVATMADVARLPVSLSEGVYLLGTGSTGAAATFATLSCGYALLMSAGALMMRLPPPGFAPAGFVPKGGAGGGPERSVHYATAMRTPQFYLLWATLFGNTFAGVTIISAAKTIMSDVFGGAYPSIVTGAFAATFVMGLAGANMMGRLTWGPLSDKLGRKVHRSNIFLFFFFSNLLCQLTYAIFGLSIPLCAAIPTITGLTSAASTAPLVAFIGSMVMIVSFYGAVFAVLPAYVADTFGQKYMGTIFGRILTALPLSALVGPLVLAQLRSRSTDEAVADLVSRVDPQRFLERFGTGVDHVAQLVHNKVVTIPRLMELMPPGTFDPSAGLYNSTLYTMSGMLTMAFVTNLLIRPVSEKFFEKPEPKAKSN